jgi:transcriptional regulator with XRE-family HTH domain
MEQKKGVLEKTKFGMRVRELRLQESITQEELAFRAGLDRTYINAIEKGRVNLSLLSMTKIMQGFNISFKLFFDSY